MHNTTVLTLLFLMFGQFLMLMCGAFVLWWIGDFGGKRFEDSAPKTQAGAMTMVRQDSHGQSGENADGLVSLAHDHSIQPHVAAHRIGREDVAVGGAERALVRSARG